MALNLLDITANNNDLTNVNTVAEYTADTPFAQSTIAADLELSSSQYLYAADSASLSFTGDFTIECWIKLEQLPSTAGSQFTLVAKFDGVGGNLSYEIDINSSDILRVLYSGDSANNTVIPTAGAIVDAGNVGAWVHIAAAIDVSAKTGVIYKNGVSQTIGTVTGTQTAVADTNAVLGIGCRSAVTGAGLFFDGVMDEVRIWNDIRTAAEIRDNMRTKLVGDEAGLVAYYPLETTSIADLTVKALVIGGGGGAGSGGGGGGGGGFLYEAAHTVTAQAYSITVGDGGAGSAGGTGSKGNNSVFDTMTAEGGGYGSGVSGAAGGSGGSGGGAGINASPNTAGSGSQGGNGGTFLAVNKAGGGGGASANGQNAHGTGAGNGGDGIANSITGASVTYAGGGGGASYAIASGTAGTGGAGGGGTAGAEAIGQAGTANLGGGGGGGAGGYASGAGGKGVVIISYVTADFGECTGGDITTDGANTVHTFNSSGTFTVVGDASAPTVTTQAASSISYNSATGNGNVTDDGGDTITERGVAWGTSTDPTTAGDKATSAGTTGAFTASMTSLTAGTHYYSRAYAINSIGTSYGVNEEFDTLAAPTATTQAVSSISYTTATGNGNITSDGGVAISERGIVWNTSTNPTTSNNKATASGTTGAFTASLTGLSQGTHYYTRAYAINAAGTSYGVNEEFDTLTAPTIPARGGPAELLYFSFKLGGNNTGKPLNQIKREYFAKFLGAGNATTPFNELELQWMLKVLANAGITPAPQHWISDLWKQMVSAIGKTPTRYVTQNKLIFFSNLI